MRFVRNAAAAEAGRRALALPGRRRQRLVASAVGVVVLAASPGLATAASSSATAPAPGPLTGSAPPAARPADLPRVLIVGDSTTVHMLAEFRAALVAKGLDPTIDARSGRTTYEGSRVLQTYDLESFDYVAVLLGANGRRANALRDMRALRAAGVDTMATVQAPERGTVNSAVRRVFASQRIKWAGYADSRGIATTDGKHYTSQAYQARARYIAGQIAEKAS